MRCSPGGQAAVFAGRVLVVSMVAALTACGPTDAAPRAADGPAVGEPVPDERGANATLASCVIGAGAVGPVRLGATLDEARRAFPQASFARSSDGDGAALVTVTRADTALMSLHALEDDAEAPIDWSRAIVFIETFSAACRTAEGIGPGSLVVDVERTYGPTTRITLAEIESREFIEFERQPAGMILRLDYSGDFAAGARETVRFAPGAKLLSIALARAP